VLHGRDQEQAALGALLDGARDCRSGVLVLRGAPGLGKTALLDDAAAAAGGLALLRATGTEAEAELAFAGLHQLLHARPVPAPLARALGRDSGPAPGALQVGAAVLAALADAGPAAVLVDDAQWLDAPSLDALAFAGRRLGAEGVALVLALGDDGPALDLPERSLAPLDDAAAAALLDEQRPHAAVRATVLAAAAGNPLALVELPAALGDRLPDGALPVPARLDRVYRDRIAALPPPARRLVLLAAAEGTGAVAPVLAAGGGELAALEASGLLRVEGDRLAWRHPLAREAVLGTAGAAAVRDAHRALAAVTGPERAAWHRAAAALAPDEAVADALAAAGRRARSRGDHAAAADALARAAELTPAPETARARRVEAAGAAWTAGRPDRALALLDAAGPGADPGEAARIRGAIELNHGSPWRAHRLLAEAARREPDRGRALRLGVSAMEAASLAGEPPVPPVPAGEGDGFLATMIAGVTARFAGDERAAAAALRSAAAQGATLEDPQLVLWAGAAAFFAGDEQAATALHERAAELARTAADASVLPFALTFLATAHLWSGRLALAEADGREARRLAGESGQENLGVQVDAVLAGVAALRGEEAACRALAEGARAAAQARGLVLAEGSATTALAELELALGAPEAAFARLDRLAHGPGAHAAHRYAVLPALVEAAARGGRAGEARAAAEAFAGWARATGSGWALPLAERSLALTAPAEEEADARFAAALELHERHRRPLDRARTELLIGERLRRARRKAEARAPLRAALEAFEDAGAIPWAERARDELRAAGESAPHRGGPSLERLTPQELQVARLVARGASNRGAAAALYLSPRTVEYHLHKVFKKLGVHARAELAAVLARADGDGRAPR
jgi:DNA-binding CsgD family transcriptional regulator